MEPEELIGKKVFVLSSAKEGVVTAVHDTRFGKLISLDGNNATAWSVEDVIVRDDQGEEKP